jgi:16S rRNA (cytosine1402-N4)-methyltransferase
MESIFYHESVLLEECIENLNIKADGIYVDVTFGGGGHSRYILSKLGANGRLVAFDQDASAIQNIPADERILFVNENFEYMHRFLRMYGVEKVDGILADLGVSSHQFDEAERGFSIRFDADLDMRMDKRSSLTAKEIVNKYAEKSLHKLFEQYGEVTNSKTLAATIVNQRNKRQVNTIADFKAMIETCVHGNPNKYLAQVFQALRIEVNKEMEVLEKFCKNAIECLKLGGRLCIISFHSLEDRIVKNCMKPSVTEVSEQQNPFAANIKTKKLKLISNKPILPTADEQKRNPRSRSAKLRVAEKI